MNGPTAGASLVRSIGRWSLAALVLNAIIGSGVFALPGTVAARLGAAGLWAWLLAALMIGVIMACFAEVASRFTGAGGPYLYAQAAFGRLTGLQMGWMSYLVRLTAAATNVNVFTVYFAEFWPGAASRGGAALLATLLLGVLAWVNYRGVRSGARVSNLFAILKLLPLGLFIVAAGWWIAVGKSVPMVQGTASGPVDWLQVLLLLIFAYGGFEAALMPLAEAKDPRRDAPFALGVGLLVVTLVYMCAQVGVLVTLPDPAASDRPIAAAAGVIFPSAGAALMAGAALLSVYGYLASGMLNVPRLTFAMAEQGDLPRAFARVHPVFRTPSVSILVYGALVWVLAVQGSLLQNLTLSAVSRLFTYGVVAAALPRLRVLEGRGLVGAAAFRLPAGVIIGALGIGCSLLLATRMTGREALLLGATMLIALAHWALVRRRDPQPRLPT